MTEVAVNLYKTVLCNIFSDKADDETISYLAEVMSFDTPRSEEALLDQLGIFLIEYKVATNFEDAKKICYNLFNEEDFTTASAEMKCNNFLNNSYSLSAMCLSNPISASDLIQPQVGFDDPFLGLKAIGGSINFNSDIPLNEAVRISKENQNAKVRLLRLMKEWERNKPRLPPPVRFHGDKKVRKLTDIVIDSFTLSVAGKELLKNTSMRLVLARRYGLVGRNGIGKSTLLSAIARHDIPGLTPDMSIGCVEQEVTWSDTTVLDAVLSIDIERTELMAEEKSILEKGHQSEALEKRLAWIYERLEIIDAASAESQASAILSGLGFSQSMIGAKVSTLSGGWRMRIGLARLLYSNYDMLLLDEPTNHLDIYAVTWLTNYILNDLKTKTIILVSHSRDFLNAVCTDIIHFADQRLSYYRGDYDAFETERAARIQLLKKQQENQEAKVKHIQSFVDRFRYNASRGALVQSRIKALNKMPMIEIVAEDPALVFKFAEVEELHGPILQFKNVSFSFETSKHEGSPFFWIFKDLTFSVTLSSRIAICGVNGSGKSTIMRLLVGELQEAEGVVVRNSKLRIGYFSQNHIDCLDLTLNAVQQLQAKYPSENISDETARSFLGNFGITGLLALEPIYILSGGQKSRVAIAVMAYLKPHLLVFDEPTNHLDLDAVQALIVALNAFQGGIVLVSHDIHLLNCVVEEVWNMNPATRTCDYIRSGFAEYKANLLRSVLSGASVNTLAPAS